jgi:hypothetical protein
MASMLAGGVIAGLYFTPLAIVAVRAVQREAFLRSELRRAARRREESRRLVV